VRVETRSGNGRGGRACDSAGCGLAPEAKLVEIGAKVVAHPRRIIFQMAEVAVPRMLFEAILKRIGELAPAAA
jgi:hypothetical protein